MQSVIFCYICFLRPSESWLETFSILISELPKGHKLDLIKSVYVEVLKQGISGYFHRYISSLTASVRCKALGSMTER